LLRDDLEQLVVEAKHLHIDLDELIAAVAEHWERLSPKSPKGKPQKILAKERT
jgi:hypothetical protein